MTSLRRLTGWAFFLECAILAVSLNACSSSGGNSGPGRVLSSIAVTPQTASIGIGATQQFKATGTYSDGSTLDITTTVQWKSSDTTVATIQLSGGLATGAGTGTAQLQRR
ncbi:MAG TPA: Ig-like domain-containing protein [Methylomirabilota bacterium]|nr:Ig-like domain-containing protein [Methylomirabilota bacterium]